MQQFLYCNEFGTPVGDYQEFMAGCVDCGEETDCLSHCTGGIKSGTDWPTTPSFVSFYNIPFFLSEGSSGVAFSSYWTLWGDTDLTGGSVSWYSSTSSLELRLCVLACKLGANLGNGCESDGGTFPLTESVYDMIAAESLLGYVTESGSCATFDAWWTDTETPTTDTPTTDTPTTDNAAIIQSSIAAVILVNLLN
jgi:hypothetical protein